MKAPTYAVPALPFETAYELTSLSTQQSAVIMATPCKYLLSALVNICRTDVLHMYAAVYWYYIAVLVRLLIYSGTGVLVLSCCTTYTRIYPGSVYYKCCTAVQLLYCST